MEKIDIHSGIPGISGILSNLHKKPFLMNGCVFQSIEGFLQGLRVENENEQKRIFMLCGVPAKVSGKNHSIKNQTLYWLGKPFNRHSDFYKELCTKAFNCCFAQNPKFQKALYDSRNFELVHTIGKNDPNITILTNDEFLGQLIRLRTDYIKYLEKCFEN